ncbi:MAG: proton-conducting transporter membrane subunit, partial [Armatimonadota bacterium]
MTQGFGLLSLLIFFPVLGALLLLFVPKTYEGAVKGLSIGISAVAFGLSLAIFTGFTGSTYHFQMVEAVPWIPQFGATYKVGIDGISIWLVLLSTLLTLISSIFSVYIDKRIKEYFICMLVLETATLGVFCSMDMLLFYSFFEVSLIPMALMIWIWGGQNRNYAAGKFFVYTFAASVFMLVGMIVMARMNAA